MKLLDFLQQSLSTEDFDLHQNLFKTPGMGGGGGAASLVVDLVQLSRLELLELLRCVVKLLGAAPAGLRVRHTTMSW